MIHAEPTKCLLLENASIQVEKDVADAAVPAAAATITFEAPATAEAAAAPEEDGAVCAIDVNENKEATLDNDIFKEVLVEDLLRMMLGGRRMDEGVGRANVIM